MTAATRLGDNSTGHDNCAPMPLVTASSDVRINGRGAGRKTDLYAPHGCYIHSLHQDEIIAGSATVFINKLPAARVGDGVSIGGAVAQGSPNITIGG